MKPIQKLSLLLLAPLTAVTLYALSQVGYLGIVEYHLPSPAGWQVFTDLVVALVLVLAWMVPDARRTNRTLWPYVIVTLFFGSFGPLAYLLLSRRRTATT